MIKKIKRINNYGIFNSLDWDSQLRDKGNNIVEFKKLNILYGRNYSGKTTLSRIIRSLETRKKHDKYINSKFQIIANENTTIDESNLSDNSLDIRVYNKDFVKDNLKWLIDEEEEITPFAILGEKNVDLESKISKIEADLGSEDNKSGMIWDLTNMRQVLDAKSKQFKTAQSDLDSKLRSKAVEIKNKASVFNVVNYNISSIKNDIDTLLKGSVALLNEVEEEEKKSILKEGSKPDIPPLSNQEFNLKDIIATSNDLIQKNIKPTVPIQDLLNDSVLEAWVRSGIEKHKEGRKTCGFCGQALPQDLWNKLDAHFSKESEDLRSEIAGKILSIQQEKFRAKKLVQLNRNQFYAQLQSRFDNVNSEWVVELDNYCQTLEKISNSLTERENDIFKSKNILRCQNNTESLSSVYAKFHELIADHNAKSLTIAQEQEKARLDLRLNEVLIFIENINFIGEFEKIESLKKEEITISLEVDKLLDKINQKRSEIESLRILLKDEKKGADKVNEYLNHFFGHNSIKLVAEENKSGFKFLVKRGEEVAHSLSEGECSLVSFCYFMAKLEDVESNGKDIIIWIDDPISSLDSNHVFFVFSLIESVIAKPKNYLQLFVSTHNLEFLKYLKRLTHPKKDHNYFIIERQQKNSTLSLMPDYLKAYITEFNYLFHQIHKCSTTTPGVSGHECFYNFGNNLRKFLEAYLYYKFPVNKPITEKLGLFFKDDNKAVELTNRLDNELSHLEEIFDRSMRPLDIPEIPRLATYVLNKIKAKDPEQYESLLQSIGVQD